MGIPTRSQVWVFLKLLTAGLPRPANPRAVGKSLRVYHRWGSSIAGAYAIAAELRPSDIALVDDWGMLCFADIQMRTNALAHSLNNIGVTTEKGVGIISRNGRAFVELSLACDKIGGSRVPINTTLAAPQLKKVIEGQALKALAYDVEMASLVADATASIQGLERISIGQSHKVGIEGDYQYATIVRDSNHSEPNPPDHPSKTVMLTSGTTGSPKGAVRPKPATLSQLLDFLQAIPRRANSVCHIAAPLYHLHGHAQFEISAALGSTTVLTSRFDPEKTLELIDRHKVRELIVVPIMLRRILDLPEHTLNKYSIESLEVVLSAGSALDHSLAKPFIERFGPILYNLYGATELAWGTVATPDDLVNAPGTIGKPFPGTKVEVLDNNQNPLGEDEKGQLFIGNDLLFSGYTDKKSYRPSVRGMMSVGDLGHYDSEGYFYIDAREDDMIVSGGENIYPGEVELVLASHPDISEASVIGVDDDEWGQSLKAFVVSRSETGLSEADVREYVKRELAGYKTPKSVVFVDSLPRNAIGKVLKKELGR